MTFDTIVYFSDSKVAKRTNIVIISIMVRYEISVSIATDHFVDFPSVDIFLDFAVHEFLHQVLTDHLIDFILLELPKYIMDCELSFDYVGNFRL